MANTLKAGSSNYVKFSGIRLESDNSLPSSYDTMECRVLNDSKVEVVAAITMSQVGSTNAYDCTIPSTASLTVDSYYYVEVVAIINTDKKRLIRERIKATED